jgi:hypothetical protein
MEVDVGGERNGMQRVIGEEHRAADVVRLQ